MARQITLSVAIVLLCGTACAERKAERLQYEPAPSHLTEGYGVTPAESARRLNNARHVGELNRRLHEGAVPFFSQLWIQHEPGYAIMVAFTRPPPRAAVLNLADPSIRGDIVIVAAKRTFAEIGRDQERLTVALQGAPGNWSAGYNPKTGKYDVTMGTEKALDYARKRIPPDLLPDVELKIGPTPVPL